MIGLLDEVNSDSSIDLAWKFNSVVSFTTVHLF